MSNKFKSTEELMEHLKKQIVQYSNGEEVALDYSSNQELPTMAGQIDIARLKQEVERNNLLWNVSADQPITSHRKVSGKLIVFGKSLCANF